MNYFKVFFILELMSFLGGVRFAHSSVPNCDSVFHSNGINPESSQLERSPEFQNALIDYFEATMTQKSHILPLNDKKILHEKLTRFAQEQKIPHSIFLSLIEGARHKYIKEKTLKIQPSSKVVVLDQQNIDALQTSRSSIKLFDMTEYQSPDQFIASLDSSYQVSTNTLIKHFREKSQNLALIESIRNLEAYGPIKNCILNEKPGSFVLISTYAFSQNPNLRQVLFYYSINNMIVELWTLQEKSNSSSGKFNEKDSWNTIFHESFFKDEINPYLQLFPFYSSERKRVIIGFLDKREGFKWLNLVSAPTMEASNKLPHISPMEEALFFDKINSIFEKNDSAFLGIYYFEKMKSFLLFRYDVTSIFAHHIRIKINNISTTFKNDYDITEEFELGFNKEHAYSSNISFPLDAAFFKITHYAADATLFQWSEDYISVQEKYRYFRNQAPPPPDEDGPFRQTKYFFPINSLQVKSSKSRSE